MDEWPEFLQKVYESGISYFWFVLLAAWGGTVNYLGRLKKNSETRFSIRELLGEWTISGFAGLLTAYVCIEMNYSWHMTAFFTGVSGHLGGRLVMIFEEYVKAKLPKNKRDL